MHTWFPSNWLCGSISWCSCLRWMNTSHRNAPSIHLPQKRIWHCKQSSAWQGRSAERIEDLSELEQTRVLQHLISWRKEQWRKEVADIPISKVINDLVFNQTISTLVPFSKANLGRLLTDGAECTGTDLINVMISQRSFYGIHNEQY